MILASGRMELQFEVEISVGIRVGILRQMCISVADELRAGALSEVGDLLWKTTC